VSAQTRQQVQEQNRRVTTMPVRCPFCGSGATHAEAEFGTTHAYSQYYCRSCRTPFEWIKWEQNSPADDLPDFLRTPLADDREVGASD
jgi:hypothetical protein